MNLPLNAMSDIISWIGLPLPFYAAGLPGLFLLLLLVVAIVVTVYFVRKYYKDDLHQLPTDICMN